MEWPTFHIFHTFPTHFMSDHSLIPKLCGRKNGLVLTVCTCAAFTAVSGNPDIHYRSDARHNANAFETRLHALADAFTRGGERVHRQ